MDTEVVFGANGIDVIFNENTNSEDCRLTLVDDAATAEFTIYDEEEALVVIAALADTFDIDLFAAFADDADETIQ